MTPRILARILFLFTRIGKGENSGENGGEFCWGFGEEVKVSVY